MSNSEKSNNFLVFRKQLSEDLEKWSESVSEDEFQRVFENLGLSKEKLKKLRHEFLRKLQENLKKGADLEIKLCSVVELHEKLTNPGHIRTEGEKAWRPPGNAASHLRAHKIANIQEACQQLEEKVASITAENQKLMKSIAAQREKVVLINKTSMSLVDNKTSNKMMKNAEIIDNIMTYVNYLQNNFFKQE